MKTALIVLLALASTCLFAENFPKNIEVKAEASMKEYLQAETEITNIQILKVQFLDMDPFAEYYLGIDWSYTDSSEKSLSCYSFVALSLMSGQPENFSEMSRNCH